MAWYRTAPDGKYNRAPVFFSRIWTYLPSKTNNIGSQYWVSPVWLRSFPLYYYRVSPCIVEESPPVLSRSLPLYHWGVSPCVVEESPSVLLSSLPCIIEESPPVLLRSLPLYCWGLSSLLLRNILLDYFKKSIFLCIIEGSPPVLSRSLPCI